MKLKKKVLILGGIKQMIGIVEAAKRMGLYTIVSDNGLGASAKRHADQSYNFSPSEIDRLAEIVVEEKVEGIFTSIDDINVWNALKLCKTVNLPIFTAHEQLEIPAVRDKFLEFCQIFNVQVIRENEIYEVAMADEGLNKASTFKVKLYYTLPRNNTIWKKRGTLSPLNRMVSGFAFQR